MSDIDPIMKKPRRGGRRKKDDHGISESVLDELLADYSRPEDLTGPDGLMIRLKKALIERAMSAELDHHLGYKEGEEPPEEQSNRRNGRGSKTLRTDDGPLEIQVARDRECSFEPQLVPKHQRHFNGFDDKILSMYARGMTVRDVQAHLLEIYGTEVSPELISTVTDGVVEELRAWQNRALEPVYMVVYLDALVVKIRDRGTVQNKAVYLAVGISNDGCRDVLGMWIQSTEGAKFWLSILSELKQRGVRDILVLCADGLAGMSQAVEATFPQTVFQTCIVHMVRSSTRFVPWKERKAVCADLRQVYTAADEEGAQHALEAFRATWGTRFPMIAKAWNERWDEVVPFLAFPPEIRKAVYTTNAIESLNRILRKTLKTRGQLPNDDAAKKLLFLALRNAMKTWGRPAPYWNQALLQFAIHFGDRVPQ